MSSRSAKGVALTPQFTRFIEGLVRTGRYRSQSEVVRDALRLMMDRERERKAAVSALREQIALGIAQAERGPTIDGEAYMRRWAAAEKQASRAARLPRPARRKSA